MVGKSKEDLMATIKELYDLCKKKQKTGEKLGFLLKAFVGGNEKAAVLSGINVNNIRFSGYILSALLAGFGGVLHASRLGASIPLAGSGLELQVIAAAVVGGASLVGGKGTILGGVLGAMFLALVFNVFVITGVSAYWIPVVNGIILILAVYFHVIFKKE